MHNSKPPEKLSFNEFAMEEKYENHRSRGMRVELFSSLLIKSRQTIFYLRCYCSRSSPIKVRLSRFGINWDPNLCFVISGDDLTLSWIGAVLSFLISWDVTEVPHKKMFSSNENVSGTWADMDFNPHLDWHLRTKFLRSKGTSIYRRETTWCDTNNTPDSHSTLTFHIRKTSNYFPEPFRLRVAFVILQPK